MFHDVKLGVALLRRDAGASALIILVVALGIGGNAAIFTLFKAALLDPLPYPNSDRLITVVGSVLDPRVDGGVVTYNPSISEFLEIRRNARSLEETAFLQTRDFQLLGANEPLRVFAARVTASFFSLIGVTASPGRTFSLEENTLGRDHVVIVTHDFWRARMGADDSAVGRTLRLDGESYQVVGVLPAGFGFDYPGLNVADPIDVYVPFPLQDNYAQNRGDAGNVEAVRVLARLRADNTVAQAAAELAAIARVFAERRLSPTSDPRSATMRPIPLQEAVAGSQRSLLLLLMGGVAVLLITACANTAQLLLARSLRRGREVSIRIALGATRARLVRQFLTEGLVLAVCGGAAGILIAGAMVRLIVRLFPTRLPFFESARPDGQVMVFAVGLSILSAILFTIVPAMKGSARMPGRHTNRWRHVMIATEAALSVFLLCGAGLIGHNLWTLMAAPKGFDPNQVLIMQLRLPAQREQTSRAYQEYLDRISVIPGVDATAISTAVPLRPWRGGFFRIAGEPEDIVAARRVPVWGYNVSPDYFRTLGIRVVAGRAFRNDDVLGRPLVCIVNKTFVRTHGIGPNPIGKQIDDGPGGLITIVGVVDDVRLRGGLTTPEPQFYTSYMQYFQPTNMYVTVRSSLLPAQLAGLVKEAIRSSYSDQPIFNVSTMDELLANAIARPRFNAFLIGIFALVACVMAASGMYSVISCLVSQRSGEIALRIALGASRAAIVRTVLIGTTAWVALGVATGLALGLMASGTILLLSSSAIVDSPAMYAGIALFSGTVTLLAAYLPVRRACRLSPALVLRCE